MTFIKEVLFHAYCHLQYKLISHLNESISRRSKRTHCSLLCRLHSPSTLLISSLFPQPSLLSLQRFGFSFIFCLLSTWSHSDIQSQRSCSKLVKEMKGVESEADGGKWLWEKLCSNRSPFYHSFLLLSLCHLSCNPLKQSRSSWLMEVLSVSVTGSVSLVRYSSTLSLGLISCKSSQGPYEPARAHHLITHTHTQYSGS